MAQGDPADSLGLQSRNLNLQIGLGGATQGYWGLSPSIAQLFIASPLIKVHFKSTQVKQATHHASRITHHAS
jgi:hypothetical protein